MVCDLFIYIAMTNLNYKYQNKEKKQKKVILYFGGNKKNCTFALAIKKQDCYHNT